MDTVDVDGHCVTTLTKRLDATGGAELMVDNLLVEMVGGHAVFTGHGHFALRYESEHHSFAFTVAAIAADGLGNVSCYFKGHCAAMTTAMICFHGYYYTS